MIISFLLHYIQMSLFPFNIVEYSV